MDEKDKVHMFRPAVYPARITRALTHAGYFTSIVLFMLALSGIARGGDYPPDIRRIIERGKLVVAINHHDMAPFFMRDSAGKLYGVDIKLAEGIASRLGVEIEFDSRCRTFDEVVETVARHEADIGLGCLSCTLDRAKRVSFTKPYITLREGMLVNRIKASQHKLESNIAGIVHIPGLPIGVEKGSSYVNFARELLPLAQVREFANYEDAVAATVKGDVAATFSDEVFIRRLVAAKPELAMYLQTIVLKDRLDPISIAVPWDSPHLLSWLNLYLDSYGGKLTVEGMLKEYSQSFMTGP